MSSTPTRRQVLGFGAGAVSLALGGAVFGTAGPAAAREAETHPTVAATSATWESRVASFPVGYSTGSSLLWASPTDAARTIDAIVAGGGTQVRIDLMWHFAQPTATTWNWEPFDRIVDTAVSRGLTILAILWSTPPWAAAGGAGTGTTRPASAADYGAFAGVVATRYRGRIASYEIWNEPNSTEFFAPGPDPVFYAAMVRAAYPAIKAADSAATVVAGAVGPAQNGNGAMAAIDFVSQMYAAGAQGYFDALSFHPYEFNQDFSTNVVWDGGPIRQIIKIYALMTAVGDGQKKIWITEYGAPTKGDGAVSEDTQSALITGSISAWAEVVYAGPFFVYTVRDGSTDDESFGVMRNNFTAKPAFAQVRQLQFTGVPARSEAEAFAASRDDALGAAVSPVFQLPRGYSQEFVDGTRSLSNKGWFSSPAPVATIARQNRLVPVNDFLDNRQDFDIDGGFAVFYTAATGAHAVVGGILDAYTPTLGLPTSDEYSPGPSGTRAVDFEHGRISWSAGSGSTVTSS